MDIIHTFLQILGLLIAIYTVSQLVRAFSDKLEDIDRTLNAIRVLVDALPEPPAPDLNDIERTLTEISHTLDEIRNRLRDSD